MAGFVLGALGTAASYVGRQSVFEYCNGDGKLVAWNCGQAAAATLLTASGVFPAEASAQAIREIERRFPPDLAGGWFGSSRRRVMQICKAYGVPLREIRGEAELRERLSAGAPVALMLGVCPGTLLGWPLPGGHWMVAYGHDDDNLYLTNWGEPMPWPDFRRRWGSLVSRVIQMSGRGLTPE